MTVIYIVQGYEDFNKLNGQLSDLTTIEVRAETEKEAIKKAKKYVARKNYRVSHVIEKE